LILKFFLVLAFSLAPLFAQWEPDQRLTFDGSLSTTSFDRCVAASNDTIHVVWYDNRDGNYEIYYKRSTDNGENWGLDTRLSNDSAFSLYPSIAIANSNIHIVWCDARDGNREIYYKRSTDGGENWGVDIRLTSEPFLIPVFTLLGTIDEMETTRSTINVRPIMEKTGVQIPASHSIQILRDIRVLPFLIPVFTLLGTIDEMETTRSTINVRPIMEKTGVQIPASQIILILH